MDSERLRLVDFSTAHLDDFAAMNADPDVMEFFPAVLSREESAAMLHRLSYGFDDLGLTEIVSFTAAINKRSMRVMEKIGMQHDPADDFDHPNLAAGDPLCRHVLYRLRRA